jgi:hypothetical protein
LKDRDLTTVNGVTEALNDEVATYETARKALLKGHQARRGKLRSLLGYLKLEEAGEEKSGEEGDD